MPPHQLTSLWAVLGGVLLCVVLAVPEGRSGGWLWLGLVLWLGSYAAALYLLTRRRRTGGRVS